MPCSLQGPPGSEARTPGSGSPGRPGRVPARERLRVALIASGLPAPTPQYVIRSTDGHFIARGDLVFEDERIVIEYDGEYHLTPEQQAKDADRRHRLMLEGWLVVTITRRDLRDPRRAVRKVNDALHQRRPIGYTAQVTAERSVVESAHEGQQLNN